MEPSLRLSLILASRSLSRGSLRNVFFPSVTLCNINQGRSSLFREMGLAANESLLLAVLRQAYLGSEKGLDLKELQAVRKVFGDRDVVLKVSLDCMDGVSFKFWFESRYGFPGDGC